MKYIFKDEIYKIADVQNVNFDLYDIEGNLIKSSKPSFISDSISRCLPADVLNALQKNIEKRYVEKKTAMGDRYQTSYNYIFSQKFKPIGIMHLPYFEDNSFNNLELKEFFSRLSAVYVIMLVSAIILALIISRYITRSLVSISDKLRRMDLSNNNEKIDLKEDPNDEIGRLVHSYNEMLDALQVSAVKLAKSEREQAWREMAKQVAHEIKNPLTPMRLSVQMYQMKF